MALLKKGCLLPRLKKLEGNTFLLMTKKKGFFSIFFLWNYVYRSPSKEQKSVPPPQVVTNKEVTNQRRSSSPQKDSPTRSLAHTGGVAKSDLNIVSDNCSVANYTKNVLLLKITKNAPFFSIVAYSWGQSKFPVHGKPRLRTKSIQVKAFSRKAP